MLNDGFNLCVDELFPPKETQDLSGIRKPHFIASQRKIVIQKFVENLESSSKDETLLPQDQKPPMSLE
jgi:hypothetical protein